MGNRNRESGIENWNTRTNFRLLDELSTHYPFQFPIPDSTLTCPIPRYFFLAGVRKKQASRCNTVGGFL